MDSELTDAVMWEAVDRSVVRVQGVLVQDLFATAIWGLAVLLNAALWPEFGSRYPLIAFYPAIALSSWFGGFGPGALCTVFSTATAGYVWFAPQFFTRPSHQGDFLALGLFMAVGLTISWTNETLRHRTQAAEHARVRAELAEARAVRLADELRGSRDRLELANRLKDEFLSTVSHELRTPLSAIMGWTDVLKAEPDIYKDRALNGIYRSAQQQMQLLGSLLDLARINAGHLELEHRSVDLQAVVETAWVMVEPAAKAKDIHARIEIDSTVTSGPFYGDALRLQQIVTNLLSNAIKFTPDRGAVHTRLRRVHTTVEIVVTDTGCGIPRDFLPFAFEPFRQASAGPQSGFGIGLSIVRHLAEAHGGEVTVASDGEGRGSTFTVRLPIRAESLDRPRQVPQLRLVRESTEKTAASS